jgi:curved DNA-binding protein CbpA
MPKVHSHYENLKVARDASPEAIRAAYRTLTRKHHPDRHPDSAEAQRIMSVVNVAYAVLSDPAKRREHDRWIRQTEGPVAQPLRDRHTLHAPTTGYAESVAADAALGAPSRRCLPSVRPGSRRMCWGTAGATRSARSPHSAC